MALTIVSAPHIFAPAYNQMYYVVNDTTALTTPEYKYVFNVFARASSTDSFTDLGFYSVYPDFVSGNGSIDVASILRPYIEFKYRSIHQEKFSSESSILEYKIDCYADFYEDDEYVREANDPSPAITGKMCFAGSFTFNNFLNYSYIYDNSMYALPNSENWLANIPLTYNMTLDEGLIIDYLGSKPTNETLAAKRVKKVKFTVYNTAAVLNGRIYDLIDAFPKKIETFHTTLGIGPKNIIGLTAGTDFGLTTDQDWLDPLPFNPYPVLKSGDYKYTVDFYIDGETPSTTKLFKTITIYIDTLTTSLKAQRRWLIYRSNKGGWSQMLFDGKPYIEQNVSKNSFLKKLPQGYNQMSNGTTIFSATRQRNHVLTKRWVNTIEQGYLDDLISANEVYLYIPYDRNGATNILTNCIIPVTITNDSLTILESWTKGNRSLTLTVQENNNQNIIISK